MTIASDAEAEGLSILDAGSSMETRDTSDVTLELEGGGAKAESRNASDWNATLGVTAKNMSSLNVSLSAGDRNVTAGAKVPGILNDTLSLLEGDLLETNLTDGVTQSGRSSTCGAKAIAIDADGEVTELDLFDESCVEEDQPLSCDGVSTGDGGEDSTCSKGAPAKDD